jgi:hypothetical protein
MIEVRWLSAGVIFGLLVSTILIPPTRKQVRIPQPNDSSVYHTETGCVRFTSIEVPCVQEADSLNVLASLTKK